MKLNTTAEIIDDFKQGKMVIIMDDEDRENEGDLVMAAECVTPEDINFMARFGRGLICLTLTEQHCKKLRLTPMVSDNQTAYATNFTVSIEAAKGVTTGISASDRALTIRAAVNLEAKAEDIVQPGHIFPLKAQLGGVLTRAGHTEAGCDLAQLSGKAPSAVIVEILNEDGLLIFTTFNIDSVYAKITGRNYHWILPFHLFYFSNKTLRSICFERNLEIFKISNDTRTVSVYYLLGKLEKIFPKLRLIFLSIKKIKIFNNLNINVNLFDLNIYYAKKISKQHNSD